MDYPSQTQRQMDADALRRQQLEDGRRMAQAEKAPDAASRKVISLPPAAAAARPINTGYQARTPAQKEPQKSKGHEAFLKALQGSAADIVVEMISSARTYYGKLRHSDKYTLTVNVTGVRHDGDTATRPVVEAFDRVLYKHDISEFYTTTPPAFAAKAGARA